MNAFLHFIINNEKKHRFWDSVLFPYKLKLIKTVPDAKKTLIEFELLYFNGGDGAGGGP
jgi:hypothetical protein